MKWMVTGDTHGVFTRFANLPKNEEIGMIILGDAGFNFYLNKTDARKKKEVSENYPNITFYCVRGNHEARPQDIPNMKLKYDPDVDGMIYMEDEYPNIRYFKDYGVYTIDGCDCAVIGGAYSVDKYWRLGLAGVRSKRYKDYYNPKKTGWFWNEQLTAEEMDRAAALFKGQHFRFVFSHTCPFEWEPNDLFLSQVDQTTVDKSMEFWMDEIKDTFEWETWLFGHFHADRLERPHVEMYYNDMEELNEICNRWKRYDATYELEWHLVKSPKFYMI